MRNGALQLGKSEPFGEVAFLTELPSPDNVWSVTVVRVLVITRTTFDGLSDSFPLQVRLLMENMQSRAEGVSTGHEAAVGQQHTYGRVA